MNDTQLRFTVTVPVKSYVYQFLLLNYGDPVDFSFHPKLHSFFTDLLSKEDSTEHWTPTWTGYSHSIQIRITERTFYHHGWTISKQSIFKFGAEFENRVKFLMRHVVAMHYGYGLPINISIAKFQDDFGFPEDIWSYDSIKKDFYRHGHKYQINYQNIFFNFQNNILRTLSDLGTVSPNLIKSHENINKTD